MTRSSLRLGSLRSTGRFALLALALGLPASLARAQCTQDADCAAGEVCASLEKPTVDCPPGQTCPTPPDEPIVEGECVGAPCTEDADCPDGMSCELGGDSSPGAQPCPRDGECPAPEPAPEPSGQCEPQPIACQHDGDCPTGLTCVEEDSGDSAVACSVIPDGGVQCEDAGAPEPATRACGFALVECEDDGDCTQQGYACTVVDSKTSCPDVPCSADGVCPEPSEEDCTPTEYRVCFPERTDCADDGDCADGWICYALPDDLTEDAPVGYEGATEVCFPEGAALAIDGEIALADVDASEVGGTSASDSGGGKATPGEAEEPAPNAGAGGGGDDGCSVAVVSGGGTGGSALVLLLASALALVRRRRATRTRA